MSSLTLDPITQLIQLAKEEASRPAPKIRQRPMMPLFGNTLMILELEKSIADADRQRRLNAAIRVAGTSEQKLMLMQEQVQSDRAKRKLSIKGK
ncbi:MAG: hypothetical protein HJJLKODD_02525 [Phycisphaerae bacterium]|nr:hypothetical protein [Phycisphaerae bacterium]